MVVRKRKKKNKLRGKRTHGKGNTKNKRGAGSRGGRGRAGSARHKRMLFLGEEKKKKLKPKKKPDAINLKELERLLDRLESEKRLVLENGLIVVDGKKLGFGKVLSRGNIKRGIKLINAKASEKALEKIINAGGTVVENEGVKSDNQ
ncbi:MAG: uL15 family ribosomal protein [Candidatus Diapherotrites archaeon]|nr:uL15 family ribosomal protein [Candidatus Diapherotrites archaeon]